MKISEQYTTMGSVNEDRSPRFVLEQLKAAGLTELASYVYWDDAEEPTRRYFVATDLGMYVAVFTPRPMRNRLPFGEHKVEATVISWAEVRGTRFTLTGLSATEDMSLRVQISSLEFDQTADRTGRQADLIALADFGRACMEREGGRDAPGEP